MRQEAASHCAFAKTLPRIGDFRASTSIILCFDIPPSKAARNWCMETAAQQYLALGCLALRIREKSPQIGDFHAAASNIPCFETLSMESDVQLVLGGNLI